MNKLHPKAIRSFFIRDLGIGFLFLLFSSFFISILLITLWGNKGLWLWILILITCIGFCYIWARLAYHNWKYELTENGIKTERGVMFKKYVTIPFNRIQHVNIRRDILDRVLNLSNLEIHTAGGTGKNHSYTLNPIKYYFKPKEGSEGSIPGLSPGRAGQLREELADRAKGELGGL